MTEPAHDPQQDYIASLEARVHELERIVSMPVSEECEELRGQVSALTQAHQQAVNERDAAVKVQQGYDEWLRGGVYFTTEEYQNHTDNQRELETKHQQAVEALKSLTEAAESVCRANNLTETQQAVRVLNTLLYHQGKSLATHKEKG